MKRFLSLVVCTILIAGMLTGCYSPYDTFKKYPWYRAECWYCEELDMTIRFSVDEDGNYVDSMCSPLVIGDKTCDVSVGFQQQAIGFTYDLDGDWLSEIILEGTWVCWGDQMVITVYEDKIFDGQYTELIFLAVEQ